VKELRISFLLDVMKKSVYSITKPLVLLINQSLEHGIAPDELKIANFLPLFKSGSNNDFANYGPVL